MSTTHVVQTKFTADDQELSSRLTGLESKFEKLAKKSKESKKGLALGAKMGAGFALAGRGIDMVTGGVSAMWQETLDSEEALVRAGTKFPGMIRKGTSAYQELRQAANAASETGLVGATQAAQGLEALGSAGLSAGAAVGALQPMLAMSSVAGVELGSAVKMAADSMTGMGLPAGTDEEIVGSMKQISDAFVWASDATTAEVQDISDAMKIAAPVSRGFGMTLSETAGTIGVLAASGLKGSEAGTALKGVLASLTATTGAGYNAMKKYGIQVEKNSEGGIDLFSTLANVAEATKDMDKVQAAQVYTLIAGREGMSAFMSLVSQGPDKLRRFRDEAANSAGSTERKFGALADTSKAKMQALQNTLMNVASEVGAGLLDNFGPVLKDVTEYASVMSQILTQNKELSNDLTGGLLQAASGFFNVLIGAAGSALGTIRMIGVELDDWTDADTEQVSDERRAKVAKDQAAAEARLDKGTRDVDAGLARAAPAFEQLKQKTEQELYVRQHGGYQADLPQTMQNVLGLGESPLGLLAPVPQGGVIQQSVAPLPSLTADYAPQARPLEGTIELKVSGFPEGVKAEVVKKAAGIDVKTQPTGGL